MKRNTFIFLLVYGISYASTLMFGIYFSPAPIANILGMVALLCYIATLLPSLLRTVFPSLKSNRILIKLLKYRRQVGVAAFGFGLNHGILLAFQLHLDFRDWHTYIHYFQGITSLSIFTILAVTSNDETVKFLKKRWRKLHQLTYFAIFILPWHILDKMAGHWTTLTPIAVLLTFTILALFLKRQWIEQGISSIAQTRSKLAEQVNVQQDSPPASPKCPQSKL